MGLLATKSAFPIFSLFLFFAVPIHQTGASTILWTAPAIVISAMMIAWAAESAQFFMAQGFALAILAWMQTLPEFAVEAVFAWHQQAPLLLANLTGALRLLTGLGWPVIYFTAAFFHRRRTGKPLDCICLEEQQSVEVVGLLLPLMYIAVITAKGSLTIYDAVVLILIYSAYLYTLTRLPPEDAESIQELAVIPRTIVKSRRPVRIAAISLLFLAGGAAVGFVADPFVGSLLAISAAFGMPSFLLVQWVAPIVSEFPELASTVYFARSADRASMALMNMVSSNINQWTLLVAMLPIVYSISAGKLSAIVLDPEQRLQLLMTLGQALVGAMYLIKMQIKWWEAAMLFVLFFVPFVHATAAGVVTVTYFVWAGVEMIRLASGSREPAALLAFVRTWKAHIR